MSRVSPSLSSTNPFCSTSQSSLDLLPHDVLPRFSAKPTSNQAPALGACLAFLITGVLLFCSIYDLNGGWNTDACVPKWAPTTRENRRCINRNSVCNAPLQSSHQMSHHCVPLKTLNEGESCWSSFDLCQDGLQCQLEQRVWSRYIANAIEINAESENANQLEKSGDDASKVLPMVDPLFTSLLSTECWTWQLHDIEMLYQQKQLQTNFGWGYVAPFWMDAKCVKANEGEDGEQSANTPLGLLVNKVIPLCSFNNIPYMTELEEFEWSKNNSVRNWDARSYVLRHPCRPWEYANPETQECQPLEEVPCQTDADCDSKSFVPSYSIRCNPLTQLCDRRVHLPCVDEFLEFQVEWQEWYGMRFDGRTAYDGFPNMDSLTQRSKKFVCCLSAMVNVLMDRGHYFRTELFNPKFCDLNEGLEKYGFHEFGIQ